MNLEISLDSRVPLEAEVLCFLQSAESERVKQCMLTGYYFNRSTLRMVKENETETSDLQLNLTTLNTLNTSKTYILNPHQESEYAARLERVRREHAQDLASLEERLADLKSFNEKRVTEARKDTEEFFKNRLSAKDEEVTALRETLHSLKASLKVEADDARTSVEGRLQKEFETKVEHRVLLKETEFIREIAEARAESKFLRDKLLSAEKVQHEEITSNLKKQLDSLANENNLLKKTNMGKGCLAYAILRKTIFQELYSGTQSSRKMDHRPG